MTAFSTAASQTRTRLETWSRTAWTSATIRHQGSQGVMSVCMRGTKCAQDPLPHILGLSLDDHQAEGTFPEKIGIDSIFLPG